MRSSRTPRRAAALTAALLYLAAGGGALAQGTKDAPAPLSSTLSGLPRAEYEAGKLLYQDGDFQNALVKFQHAYDLSHDARLLWNVAVCEKNLRRYTHVLTAIERYLAEAGPMLSAQDRQDANDLADASKPLVTALRVTVSEPGAEIFVDDEKVGASPLKGAVFLDIGKRRIHVVKPGYRAFDRAEDVAGGGNLTIVATLERDVHQGRIAVEAGVKDLIALDGKAVAQGRWEGKVGSGGHTLRVTSPGMATYQAEVQVKDDETRRISVALNPLPKTSDATTWLWIAGGAALVAGAVVGGALLFQPTQRPSVEGSLGTFQLSFGGRR